MNMSDPTIQFMMPMVLMAAIFYFLIWRPQSQRTKQLRQLIANVRRGDTVVMASGMVGKIAKTPDEKDTEVLVEIADNVQVRVIKSTLSDVRPKGADAVEKA